MAASATVGQPKSFVTALLELGHHPNMRIVRELVDGPRRYNEILQAIPDLAEPLVGTNLRELDGAGLVARRVDPGPPLRVLYELTALGRELAPSFVAIEAFTRRAGQA
ncbi:MAG: hypothetical protein NVS2B3_00630 [Vulcanimicrobiaceae bacterium]